MLFVVVGDFIDTTEDNIRAVSKLGEVLHGSDTGEHEDGVDFRADTSSNVGVHAVANDAGFAAAEAEGALSVTHDKSRGLAAEECLGLSDNFNAGSESTAGGDLVALGVQVLDIQVGSDKLSALADELDSLGQALVVVGRTFAEDNVIGVVVVHEETFLVQCIGKTRLANDVASTAFGHL